MPTPLRVALVEDDPGIRAGIRALLEDAEGFVCAGTFGSIEEMLARFDGEADVMLMDINLPMLSGIEGVPLLKSHHPDLPIVMLTVYDDTERIFAALKAGATGYLLKRTPPHLLFDALDEVHRGGAPMSASIARKVVDSFHVHLPDVPAEANLTPRERDVLHYLAQGYRYREIAEALYIGSETVRSHIRSIYNKLHVRTRTEAVLKYLGH